MTIFSYKTEKLGKNKIYKSLIYIIYKYCVDRSFKNFVFGGALVFEWS